MPRELPARPNLRNLKNQAKTLLKQHRDGDRRVCRTLRNLRALADQGEEAILRANLSLTDVQFALALDYGFPSWNALREHVLSVEAAGESYEQLFEQAQEIYTRKGPPRDHVGSDFDRDQKAMNGKLLSSGETGLLVAVQLSRSSRAKLRGAAALIFGFRADRTAKEHLRRMMHDQNQHVRSGALNWYAAAIHPEREAVNVWKTSGPARFVPGEAYDIVPLMKDARTGVRASALNALGAYAGLNDPVIEKALREALNDPVHKLTHHAASVLRIRCPKCGDLPEF
jgi:hypothetical protein